ncbi:hypothetical protein [Streptomyces sp. NPDC050600]|uniref:hypothetical protein n=1 Tax=Streptomyces sp. NPDC050600 TaxID=3157213 RepID=UPI0034229B68
MRGNSPFGPAADRWQQAAFIPGQLVEKLEEVSRATQELMETHQSEVDRLQRKVAAETERRRDAERKFQEAVALLRQGKNLEEHVDSLVSGLLKEVLELPPAPDVAELLRRLEESEAERATLAALLEESENERRAALRARNATLARLQPRLEDGQDDADVHALRARLDAPTFEGVLELAVQFCGSLAITADPAETRKLEHHHKSAHWRGRLVDALATMQMYAEAKDVARARAGGGAGAAFSNLRAYCASQAAPLLSDKKIAHNEGQLARSSPRGRSERTFLVPEDVSASGIAVMVDHIRIGDGAPPAPRLHFLDDTDRSGLIVIGFFGDHRFNAQTN